MAVVSPIPSVAMEIAGVWSLDIAMLMVLHVVYINKYLMEK